MKAKIYTKTGDSGQTSLVGGTRVAKTDKRLDAYGTLDELNSQLGVIRAHLRECTDGAFSKAIEGSLERAQNNLFNIGSHLACEDEKLGSQLPGLSSNAIGVLEGEMDQWESELSPLKNFILPGGSVLSAHTHVARTICRRAERLSLHVVSKDERMIYLNRLSDWLFLLARKFNQLAGQPDLPWTKP